MLPVPRYLVTGGAGFIGSSLVEELVKNGHRPRVLDNFATGRRQNLASFGDAIELVEGDIRDPSTVETACRGISFILHQAALPSVARSIADPELTNDVNVNGTLRLLSAARVAGVRRFVFAASSSVYGDTPSLPKTELMVPNPLSPYAVSKLAGESYCRAFFRVYGLETVCLRYFNVFGPRQDPSSQYSAVIPRFVSAIISGEPPVIFGNGQQSRDFTFISNVVSANLAACEASGIGGEVMNIGAGAQTKLLDVFDFLKRELGAPDIQPRFESPRTGDIRDSFADIVRAERLIGYRPAVDVFGGLRMTARAMRN